MQRDFQDFNDEISGNWDFSGDPCPVSKYEWSVKRLDGTNILPFTAIPKGETRNDCKRYGSPCFKI